ncbi:putative short-subunit dehydrogenase-like oxidoreductase (DUF2520 family) [Nonlabens dokdonensis]|uniref:DUF2520 multi-domain protein n=2 Tax=Nonlabens dokdonensis TaxID=328515 RepID=L7WHN7_NONDD|nr:Rossmann-like and DUF2520 domain-containing protein [Nonlabens dokdonensis]AGC78508.1 DUF2520 multi-domain protein [Nonlabens dokdonensis DSW-6]PZX38250.1 putative short-subunit dehydrogenase-like oxidoreductase (DUF2520 family) [Nonlabens dokdonensis]
MIKIIVIGTGNVGTHLCRAFEKAGSTSNVQLAAYHNRGQKKLPEIDAPLAKNLNHLPNADLILLAVPDDAIASVAEDLPAQETIIAHTSGSVAMQTLNKHKNHGVFYLPQSFSISRTPNFEEITICMESSNDFVNKTLEMVAVPLSRKRAQINSQQRKKLHLAAVYINNFVNHCYTKAGEIMEEAAIDHDLLDALMRETFDKAIDLSPKNAQTGPALRNDSKTIEKHLQMLEKEDRDMYRSITKSIQKTHGKKL